MTSGPPLGGVSTVLRELRPEDLDAVHRIVGDPRVTDWLSFDNRSRAEAERMLEGVASRRWQSPRQEYYLGIVPRGGEDTVVGFARLALSGVRAGEIGYAVAHDHQRRGYARDAIRTLLEFGYRELELHRIVAAIGPRNTASLRLVEELGMSREGVLRDHVFTNGEWRDSVLYSLLAQEWVATRAA